MGFVEKLLRIALAMGLVLGLVLFSVLLYVSDFGGSRHPAASPSQSQAAVAETTPNTGPATADPARSVLQWVFGAPQNPDTTAP